MKVGTDGVLLGAWAQLPLNDKFIFPPVKNEPLLKILDIGTGTGLIALMLAQRICSIKNNCPKDFIIDAIDVDESSFKQAKENIEKSKHGRKIKVYHLSFQKFLEGADLNSYHLIVSNPPFFKNSLKSKKPSRNLSRHSDYSELSSEILISSVKKLIAPEGKFCLILPKTEGENFMAEAKKSNLYCAKITKVFSKANKEPKRYLMQFQNFEDAVIEDNLTIETGDGLNNFTPEYKNLTRDFYLNF